MKDQILIWLLLATTLANAFVLYTTSIRMRELDIRLDNVALLCVREANDLKIRISRIEDKVGAVK